MENIKSFDDFVANNEEHVSLELICVKCHHRAWHTFPETTYLKNLECVCGEKGFLIFTGQPNFCKEHG